MNRKIRFQTIGLLTIFLLLLNCEKENEVGSNSKKPIGQQGGIIETSNGSSLIIPKGALAENTAISMNFCASSADFSNFNQPLPGFLTGVNFGPDGLKFAIDAEAQLLLTNNCSNNNAGVFWFNSTEERWDQVSKATINGSIASFPVSHFSSFAVLDYPADLFDKLDNFLGDGRNAEQAVDDYINWLVEQAGILNKFNIFNDCCYKTVGFSINGDYKVNDIEGTFVRDYGTVTSLKRKVYMHGFTDYMNTDGDIILVSKYLTLYLQCSPTLSLSSEKPQMQIGEKSKVTIKLVCGGKPFPGKKIKLEESDNLLIDKMEVTTNENGEATIIADGFQGGIGTIMASYNACECDSAFPITESVNIQVGIIEEWEATATITLIDYFGQYTDDEFSLAKLTDNIKLNFSFTFDPSKAELFSNVENISGSGRLTHSSISSENGDPWVFAFMGISLTVQEFLENVQGIDVDFKLSGEGWGVDPLFGIDEAIVLRLNIGLNGEEFCTAVNRTEVNENGSQTTETADWSNKLPLRIGEFPLTEGTHTCFLENEGYSDIVCTIKLKKRAKL